MAPPARQGHPLPEGYPPVVEMLLGEADPCSITLSRVGDGGQTSTARRLADPGGDDALGRDQHTGLFVELADGPYFEALARLKTSGRRLPGTSRALEQEHAAVFPDGQESRDEIRLQGTPTAKMSVPPTTHQVYGPRRPHAVGAGLKPVPVRTRPKTRTACTTQTAPAYEPIFRGSHARTSRRLEK